MFLNILRILQIGRSHLANNVFPVPGGPYNKIPLGG